MPWPMVRISASPIPREVMAGVPKRMPPPSRGGRVSNGIGLEFTTMPAASRASAAWTPFRPSGRTSTRTRWLSVPPEISTMPASASAAASAFALATTWFT